MRASLFALLFTLAACGPSLPEYKGKLTQARVSAYIETYAPLYNTGSGPPVSTEGNTLVVNFETDARDAMKAQERLKKLVGENDFREQLRDAFIAQSTKALPFPVAAESKNVDTEIQVRLYVIGLQPGTEPGKPVWMAAVQTRVIYIPERKEVWNGRDLVTYTLDGAGPGGAELSKEMFAPKTFLYAPDDKARAWLASVATEAARKAADTFVAALNKPQS
ncbi:MAG TPA: hypothetical protein VF815_24430 [Myxococcaceae bacterium]